MGVPLSDFIFEQQRNVVPHFLWPREEKHAEIRSLMLAQYESCTMGQRTVYEWEVRF